MEMTPVAMVVSASSLRYKLKILLYLIKAYGLVRREKFMTIVDEVHSVDTPGMVETLLQLTIVMAEGDEKS